MPLVSIIVPNYNHAKFLKKRLDSIFQQIYRDFEVILLDDASTDNSVEVLTDYANHSKVTHFIVNEKNSESPFKQWKKGIDLARGEYIWIAESDDWADKYFLDKAVHHFDKKEDINLVYGKSVIINGKGNIISIYNYKSIDMPSERWEAYFVNEGQDEIKEYLYRRNTIPNASAVLMKRAPVLKEVNKITTFRMMGDWILWIKTLISGKVIYDPEMVNYFRVTDQSTIRHNTPKKIFYRYFEHILLNNFLLKRRLISKEYFFESNDFCLSKIQHSGYLNIAKLPILLSLPAPLLYKASKKIGYKIFLKITSYYRFS